MNKQLWLSPSAISDFKNCPRLYWYRSIYRNPVTGYRVNIVTPQLTLGGVIHDTLARFVFLEKVADRKAALEEIFEKLWAQKSDRKGGFASAEEEEKFKGRGRAILEKFLKNEHFQSTTPVRLSASVDYLPKVPLNPESGEVIICGKLDWIENLPDGSFAILDFKTGAREEPADSIQLPFYAYLLWRLKSIPVKKASFWHLGRDEKPKEITLPEMGKVEQQISEYAHLIKQSIRPGRTKSLGCRSSEGRCFWCRPFEQTEKGEAELVDVDHQRRQELYVVEAKKETSDLPF